MVAGGNNAVFRKQQHGARTLDMLIYIFDALHKVSALYQEQGYKFCLIGFAGAQFGEVHVLFQKFGFQGTPAIVFQNGSTLKGYAENARLEEMLAKK